jgi:putative endonuclease
MPSSENSKIIMSYVYILESVKNDSLYIGYTSDLKKRFKEHNNGLNTSTRYNRPRKLIYYEACLNKKDAERRENYFKTTSGRRAFKLRLREHFYCRVK